MAIQRPKSMSDLDYYTRRVLGEGKAEVWVFKQKCACGGLLKKPKKKSPIYVCAECMASVPVEEYEGKQVAGIAYTCPSCKHTAEKEEPFVRKKVGIIIKGKRKSVLSFQFVCDSCGEKINVTKKLKG
ncbi:hypothetical protein HOF46_02710 [Candidatus Woesearchaeota archaeon]|jgi:hypothetical protein|nr:hypothetical protein [Candidatus Woesearchaeota archaeon]MBT4114217.1 hypothetical protein [Candidatus Woesearchaeota archaeon]